MDKIHVFVSFDLEHDQDLYALMRDEAARPDSGFEICGRSELRSAMDHWSDVARSGIRQADQVIFLCGEHTGEALAMGTELLIAQEENTPYLLVWGRRAAMCTKPHGARPAEAMYSWTSEILKVQMDVLRRSAQREATTAPAPVADEA